MTRDDFLNALQCGLRGLPEDEIEDILAEYSAHFAESALEGRSEAEVALALGDPARTARELRADADLGRLEKERSLGNLAAAVTALAGLALVDLVVLLPLLLLIFLVCAGLLAALLALGAAGLKVLVTTAFLTSGAAPLDLLARLCIGAGLVSGVIGGAASALIGLGTGIRLLGRYARLHFRLIRPERTGA